MKELSDFERHLISYPHKYKFVKRGNEGATVNYDLSEKFKNLYLFIVKNYLKQPKERYFLAVILASQSSDLLVSLANEFAQKNALKLVQYAINPKQLRVSLISLKEIENIEDYSFLVELLKEFRAFFRKMLGKIKNTIE